MLACRRGNASEKLDLRIFLKLKSSHLKDNKQFFSFQIETNLSFGKFTKMDI